MKPITKRLLTGGVTAVLVFSALLAVQMRPQPLFPAEAEIAVTAVTRGGEAVALDENQEEAVAALLVEQTGRRMVLTPAPAADDAGWTVSFRVREDGEWTDWQAALGEKAVASQGKKHFTLPGGADLAAALDETLT